MELKYDENYDIRESDLEDFLQITNNQPQEEWIDKKKGDEEQKKRFIPPTSNVYLKGDNKQGFRDGGQKVVLPLTKIDCTSLSYDHYYRQGARDRQKTVQVWSGYGGQRDTRCVLPVQALLVSN